MALLLTFEAIEDAGVDGHFLSPLLIAPLVAGALDLMAPEFAILPGALFKLLAVLRREEAARLRAEADERDPKTQELLRQLQDFEGCEYAPVQPPRPSMNGWVGGSPVIINVPTPRTKLLRIEANNLEYGASQRESLKVGRSGHVELGSPGELLEHLHANPLHVGCLAIEVLEYFEKAEAREDTRRARLYPSPDQRPPMVYVLAYRDGVLDEAKSKVHTRTTY